MVAVAYVGTDGATSVCVEVAPGVRVSAPADAVALLPFTAARKGTTQRALVLAPVGDHLRVNPSGPAVVGGVDAPAGDRFEITNGCAFSYSSAKTPNGTCDDVKDNRLVTPGG